MSELAAEEMALSSVRPTSVRLTLGGAAIAALLNIVWGTNPAALKLAMQGLPPMGATGVRFCVAAVGTVVWCVVARTRMRPRAGEARWLALVIGSFIVADRHLHAWAYTTGPPPIPSSCCIRTPSSSSPSRTTSWTRG